MKRYIGVWLVAIALLAGVSRAADDEIYRIPGGQEKVVQGVFAPKKLDDDVASGFLLDAINIKEKAVEVHLKRGGEDIVVVLKHPSEAAQSFSAGGFSVDASYPETVAAADQQAVAKAVQSLLAANTKPDWWTQFTFKPTATPPPPPPDELAINQPAADANGSVTSGDIPASTGGGSPPIGGEQAPSKGQPQAPPGKGGLPGIVYLLPLVLILGFVIFVLPRFADDDDETPSGQPPANPPASGV